MNTYVFESPRGEIRVTVIADTEDEARYELGNRIMQLENMSVDLTTHAVNFELISRY